MEDHSNSGMSRLTGTTLQASAKPRWQRVLAACADSSVYTMECIFGLVLVREALKSCYYTLAATRQVKIAVMFSLQH